MLLQEKNLSVLHIESRKSRKYPNEFEIFVDVDMTCDVTMNDVMTELKRRVTSLVMHDGDFRPYLNNRKTISLDKGDTMC